jgi:methylated-DNA-protein-cysteine methyltransferase-like protein
MTETQGLPWHRIIRADGRIALPEGGGREEQIALLHGEGVEASKTGQVDLNRYGFYRSGGIAGKTGRLPGFE